MSIVESYHFVLYGQPTTKKNSLQLVYRRERKVPVILPSKAYRVYEGECRRQMAADRALPHLESFPHFDEPVAVKALYYLQNRAYWPDLLGLEQATADIISDEYKVINHKRTLVREWLLSDDRIIKSWDGSKIAGIDKDNPRVEIWIYPLPLDAEAELDPKLSK